MKVVANVSDHRVSFKQVGEPAGFLWRFLYPSPALESLNRGGSVAESSAGFDFAVFSEHMLPRVQPWISRGAEPRGCGAFSANKSRIGNVLEKKKKKKERPENSIQ